VTNTISRLYGKILRDLVEDGFKEKEEEEEQCDFKAGRSCTDNVFCLKQIIEKRSTRNLETHITFIDITFIESGLCTISKLWKVLKQSNINHNYTYYTT